MKLQQLYSCHFWEIDQKVVENLQILLEKLQRLEDAYGSKFEINSGYRTNKEHAQIYKKKNDKRKNLGLPQIPPPLHSKHLAGQAADISDPHGYVKAWIDRHPEVVKEIDLYFEEFSYCPGYVHVQIVPPKSGRRFFKPW